VTFATDPALWRWTAVRCLTEQALRGYLAAAVAGDAAGECLAFATVYRGQVVGSTRFGSLVAAHKRCEIGWTFVRPDLWGSAVNARVKWLMLQHAFETAGMNRVEFKTDARNDRSRRALLALGATEEGTLRRHMVCDDGHLRDSVYFSIVREEWPGVSARLLERIARKAQSAR
jgi:RimJ/RimL family protein N-acetyltransferase